MTAPQTAQPLLSVQGLSVGIPGEDGVRLIDDVSFQIGRGETLGLVGESGSGKSVSCQAVLGLLPDPLQTLSGSVVFDGVELAGRSRGELSRLRGNRIGMVFQTPLSSLNPAFTIGQQVTEGLREHRGMSRRQARARAIELLDLVRIPAPHLRVDNYPHEMSGGMAQRALIAMAIACEPDLLIADEPTTALDVTIQLQILDLLRSLQQEMDMALLLVSHDLGVITHMCERVEVMYAGQVVETGPVDQVFREPTHPYTSALISSSAVAVPKGQLLTVIPGQVPRAVDFPRDACRFANRCAHAVAECTDAAPPWSVTAGDRANRCLRHDELDLQGIALLGDAPHQPVAPDTEAETPILELTDLVKHFAVRTTPWKRQVVHAVDDVNLTVGRGRILGLVGESGSGKSTVGRLALRLIDPSAGRVVVMSQDLQTAKPKVLRRKRKHMQMVFQDPFGTLDPLMTVGQSIAEPLSVHFDLTKDETEERIASLLDRVGLDPALARRTPAALSGGQRQRVAIARALAVEPDLIVCDEAVSALDVSTRAQIINLIQDLKEREGIAFLFIAHDLATVHHISDEIAVMYLGRVVEAGPAGRVYHAPQHPYTRALLASVLKPGQDSTDTEDRAVGEIPSPVDPPSGCRFRTRCRLAMDVCATTVPLRAAVPDGGWSACHLTTDAPASAPVERAGSH